MTTLAERFAAAFANPDIAKQSRTAARRVTGHTAAPGRPTPDEIRRDPTLVAAAWAEKRSEHFDTDEWIQLFRIAGYCEIPRLRIATHRSGTPWKRRPGPLTLYRGAHPQRRFGLSWTQCETWARDYATWHGGCLYTHTAEPAEYLARIYSGRPARGLNETDEYVLDAHYLNDDNVALVDALEYNPDTPERHPAFCGCGDCTRSGRWCPNPWGTPWGGGWCWPPTYGRPTKRITP
jgi:hypothetical protein